MARRGAGAPGALPDQLATLEEHVEAALAGSVDLRGAEERVRGALDDLLTAYAGLRRELGPELLAAATLRALYRWWWRIEAVGLERVPAGRVLLVANRAPSLFPYEDRKSVV